MFVDFVVARRCMDAKVKNRRHSVKQESLANANVTRTTAVHV